MSVRLSTIFFIHEPYIDRSFSTDQAFYRHFRCLFWRPATAIGRDKSRDLFRPVLLLPRTIIKIVRTEKPFQNLNKTNRNQIVFTIFRLI